MQQDQTRHPDLIAAVIFLATAFFGAWAVAIWQSPSQGTTFVEMVKLLLSGPAIAGGITILAGGTFRREISELLGRIEVLKGPGGVEMKAPPIVPAAEALLIEAKAIEKADEQATDESQEIEISGLYITHNSARYISEDKYREDLTEAFREMLVWKMKFLLYAISPIQLLIALDIFLNYYGRNNFPGYEVPIDSEKLPGYKDELLTLFRFGLIVTNDYGRTVPTELGVDLIELRYPIRRPEGAPRGAMSP